MNIHDLVLIGDAKALEELISSHPNPKQLVNLSGGGWTETPLFIALRQPHVNLEVVRLLLEAGADPNQVRSDSLRSPGRDEFAIALMLKHGNLSLLKLFEKHGARLRGVFADGYTAVLWAIYAENDAEEIVEYLLQKGFAPNARTYFSNDTPIYAALRLGRYRLVDILLAAGAEESERLWTPLIKVCAIGTLEEVQRILAKTDDLDADDATGRSALDVALRRGHREIVDALLAAGASVTVDTKVRCGSLGNAISSGNLDLVRLVLDKLAGVDSEQSHFDSALESAVAHGNSEVVRMLIEERGASFGQEAIESALEYSDNRDIILMLLDIGADPAKLSKEGRRVLVGLPAASEVPLATISEDQYRAARYVREGRSNPEDLTDPFRLAMVQAGLNAYAPRCRFNDPPSFACGLTSNDRPPQVWCFDRFGQSFTPLPDGRTILIAGEHEDSYDPDFCIYNDVTVIFPDGQIQLFGYPYSVFEPTDFHTATLVGDFIWIIGGLGYMHQREGHVPVYRLDVRDYSIERIETYGAVPPRFYNHRATLVGESEIEVHVHGSMLGQPGKPESTILRLDTASRNWTIEG